MTAARLLPLRPSRRRRPKRIPALERAIADGRALLVEGQEIGALHPRPQGFALARERLDRIRIRAKLERTSPASPS